MKRKNYDHSNITNGFIGYGITMLVDLLSALIVSIFIFNEYFEVQQIQPAVFITHFLAAFCGVRYLIKRVGERKILHASVIAGAYYLTQIIAAMLLFDGLNSRVFMCFIPIFGGTAGAILIGAKPKSRTKRRVIRK